ncbi:hypothetical protein C8R45DRAFT_1031474, partial [Mycena sanguinolenta]
MRVVPGRFGDHLTRRTQTRSRSRRYIGTGCRRRTSAALRRRLGRRPAQAQTHPIFVVVSPPQFPACSEPALHPPQRRSTPRPLRTSLPLPTTVSEAIDVDVDGATRLLPLPACFRTPVSTRIPDAALPSNSWRFWPNSVRAALLRGRGRLANPMPSSPSSCSPDSVRWMKAEACYEYAEEERKGGGGKDQAQRKGRCGLPLSR